MFRGMKTSFWLPAALFAVAMSLSLAVFADHADTLWYMIPMRDYLSGADSAPWHGLTATLREHWLYDLSLIHI